MYMLYVYNINYVYNIYDYIINIYKRSCTQFISNYATIRLYIHIRIRIYIPSLNKIISISRWNFAKNPSRDSGAPAEEFDSSLF